MLEESKESKKLQLTVLALLLELCPLKKTGKHRKHRRKKEKKGKMIKEKINEQSIKIKQVFNKKNQSKGRTKVLIWKKLDSDYYEDADEKSQCDPKILISLSM